MKKELINIKDINPIVAEYYTEFETIEERDLYIEKIKKYCKENNIPCYLDSEYPYNKPMTFEQFEKIYYSLFPDRKNGDREGWIRYEYK